MQTLEVVSAQAKNISSISAGRKKLLPVEIPAIWEALDRIQTQRLKKPANPKPPADDDIPAGQIQCSHILREKAGQAVVIAALQNLLLPERACFLHLQDPTTCFDLRLLTDQDIDQVPSFFIENAATDITSLLSTKARQSVSAAAKAIVAGCGAPESKTKKYIAFLHPTCCCPSLNSNASCAIDTIYVVFRRKAYPGVFSGFIPLQAPAFKVRNYHSLGKSKGRIFKIKG